MKTEQEQIKEIANVLCDYCKNNTNIGKPCKSSKGVYICTSEIQSATAIVQAGYGDVSEYKAEIKRLKSNNGFLQCVISHSKDMMDEAVKQAQIDVLNKVKERAVGFAAIETYHICNLIDKIIKEVQDE